MPSATRPVARWCTCTYHSAFRTPIRQASRASTITISQKRQTQSRRWQSTDSSTVASSNPKIASLVDQIGQLTLLETADLVSSLKSRLNIPDMPIGNFASGPASGATVAAPVEEEEEAAPKAQEKTLFNLTLKSFDAAAKPKVIKEIKSLLNLSLVESKKFVESAPKQMKENVSKEDGEKIIETLKAVGAVVVME